MYVVAEYPEFSCSFLLNMRYLFNRLTRERCLLTTSSLTSQAFDPSQLADTPSLPLLTVYTLVQPDQVNLTR